MQVYQKTYSWAHNTNDANWAAYITIARAPEHGTPRKTWKGVWAMPASLAGR